MAVEITPRGYKVPDGATELVKRGAEVIGDNARKADADVTGLANRVGVAEAKINAGAGGVGLSEDPENAGLWYFAGPSFAADPSNPGLYVVEVAP